MIENQIGSSLPRNLRLPFPVAAAVTVASGIVFTHLFLLLRLISIVFNLDRLIR